MEKTKSVKAKTKPQLFFLASFFVLVSLSHFISLNAQEALFNTLIHRQSERSGAGARVRCFQPP